MLGTKIVLNFCVVITIFSGVHSTDVGIEESKPVTCAESGTELINEDETFLYLSTLDGTFIGVNQKNGDVIWKFKEEAAVKVPVDSQNALSSIFLPDPRDGSLYLLNSENNADLKKLQFTIQQLVTTSPCRSSDGIFYTGKKVDNWFMVDWRTGIKEELINANTPDKTCPLLNRNALFLGRTEYNLIIHDVSRKERRWNVTYYDYSAKIISPETLKNHGHLYFSGSSTGKFAVLKSSGGGSLLWESDFGSPVIGVYVREGDGLVSLPFTTMDDTSMPLLGLEFTKQIKLLSTLYVGAHTHGMYALSAYATSHSDILLLNGPTSVETDPVPDAKKDETTALLGYYEIPHEGIERLQVSGRNDVVIEMHGSEYGLNSTGGLVFNKIAAMQVEDVKSSEIENHVFYQFVSMIMDYILSSHNIELKIFMFTMLAMMLIMFVYFRAQVREFKSSSTGFIKNNYNTGVITAISEELPDGSTRVGKILFKADQILGKGCEGTFVFKGEFDNRHVAVKRLLPECFSVADREVCLLRESDQHPNVIRYFCMEQDKQFRYIALELCSATLQEYTEKGVLNEFISPAEALAQAVAGLEHLHALNIVHRDVKPHNVLLSFPTSSSSSKETKVRAVISDFGLCKKLQLGKVSFSRKSGITGTDGWIAPEMIHGRSRTTTAVDIFSMGCVFYYVLSKGKHPFGDSLSRQANIMIGKYALNEIMDDNYDLWLHLISKMVTLDPLERPTVSVIKNHPAFWSKDRILTFLQDASDRIEKEETTSKILLELETGNSFVLKGDWRDDIEQEIADDLRKYRTYRSDSVRDLLRALRNKKHHYRELSPAVRDILGSIPDQFVTYWMDRFPKLLLHTWLAMQCVNHEAVFHKYYCNLYKFPSIHNGDVPSWIQTSLNMSARWKFLGKVSSINNSNGNCKANPRYDKSTSRFFVMNNKNIERMYNWRHRANAICEEEVEKKPSVGLDATLDASEENADVDLEVELRVEEAKSSPQEEDVEKNDENVKLSGVDENILSNDDFILVNKSEKKRSYRTRNRNRKKSAMTGRGDS